jgi:subtilisin family serine protease
VGQVTRSLALASLTLSSATPALERLPWVAQTDEPAQHGLLEVAPGVGAIRLTAQEAERWSRDHPEAKLERAGRVVPLLDVATGSTGVVGWRADTGLSGTGVVVGVVDRAFDVAHASLRNETGQSRIAWLLAHGQPLGNHPVVEQAFGCDEPQQSPCRVYSGADIDALLASGDTLPAALADADGHGTHVASIAAGTAVLGYGGVAPDASLVLVAFDRDAYVGSVLRGARFVFDRADELASPAVLNLSSGYHGGRHDGSSALEAGLAAFVGDEEPGRAIVVSAGNHGGFFSLDGARDMGVHTTIEPGACTVPLFTADAEGSVEVWLSHEAGAAVTVGVNGPDGEVWLEVSAQSTTSQAAGVALDLLLDETGGRLRIEGTLPLQREVTLSLQSDAYVDAWVHSEIANSVPNMVFALPSRDGTVTMPASHPALIAVGATVNRETWPSTDGVALVPDVTAGALAEFSAAGPMPGAWLKPDITAPGQFVVAAMSAAAHPDLATGLSEFTPFGICDPPQAKCTVVSEELGALAGTSMAAPHVAGAVALLLEQTPTLSQPALRERILDVAQVATEPRAGGGTLDLSRLEMGTLVDVARSSIRALRSYARVGVDNDVLIRLRDAAGQPVASTASELAVTVAGGSLSREPEPVAPSLFRAAYRADDGATAVLLSASHAGVPLGEIEVGVGLPASTCVAASVEPSEEGCGCATVGSRAPFEPWLCWLALVVVRRRTSPAAGA